MLFPPLPALRHPWTPPTQTRIFHYFHFVQLDWGCLCTCIRVRADIVSGLAPRRWKCVCLTYPNKLAGAPPTGWVPSPSCCTGSLHVAHRRIHLRIQSENGKARVRNMRRYDSKRLGYASLGCAADRCGPTGTKVLRIGINRVCPKNPHGTSFDCHSIRFLAQRRLYLLIEHLCPKKYAILSSALIFRPVLSVFKVVRKVRHPTKEL